MGRASKGSRGFDDHGLARTILTSVKSISGTMSPSQGNRTNSIQNLVTTPIEVAVRVAW
jgi:hypothetical protein